MFSANGRSICDIPLMLIGSIDCGDTNNALGGSMVNITECPKQKLSEMAAK